MTSTFEHLGQTRQITKHPAVLAKLKAGTMAKAEAATQSWFIRIPVGGGKRKWEKLAALVVKDAVREAKDLLNGMKGNTDTYTAYSAARKAAASVTLGALAKEWLTAGLPEADGRKRSATAVKRLGKFLNGALRFFETVPAMTITGSVLNKFAAWRRENTRGDKGGHRSIDVELGVLSGLCAWAAGLGKLPKNPFADRDRFARDEDAEHCHEHMPSGDDELHQILNWFFTPQKYTKQEASKIVAGAWLAFCALSGLRPGEPAFLQRHPALTEPPLSPRHLAPGTVFTTRDGQRVMKVNRLKSGQNNFIALRPALERFLNIWEIWLNANLPQAQSSVAPHWFPDPSDPGRPLAATREAINARLNVRLGHACRACKTAPMKPHGFGRAYYVRVRRSQGVDDSAIAGELGQTSNGKLIRSVYGDPDDMVGGALFDWLPETGQPAWELLANAEVAAKIIRIA